MGINILLENVSVYILILLPGIPASEDKLLPPPKTFRVSEPNQVLN